MGEKIEWDEYQTNHICPNCKEGKLTMLYYQADKPRSKRTNAGYIVGSFPTKRLYKCSKCNYQKETTDEVTRYIDIAKS